MKRISALATAAGAIVTTAAPAATQDLDGFYIGVPTGYTDGEADQPYGNFDDEFAYIQDSADVSGWVYGIQGGYNFQIAPRWVLGLEAQAA